MMKKVEYKESVKKEKVEESKKNGIAIDDCEIVVTSIED
jgi:hypothetical protein